MRPPLRLLTLASGLLCAAPTLAQTNSVGLNVHTPDDAMLDAAAASGVQWVRMDANWLSLEPRAGAYRFEQLEPAVNGADRRGLRVFMTLAYTPDWVPRVPRARTDTNPGNDEPAGSVEWEAFVEAAVRHYRALGVTHFGLWNGANLEQFWDGDADAYYDKIVVPGAAALRRACADCVVLAPDLAHVGDYDAFLRQLLSRGLVRHIDILAHHIYSGWPETGTGVFDGDNFLQALEMRRFSFTRASLREVLDGAGYRGEVWITETGYRAHPVGPGLEEDRQAIYVRRVLEEQLLRDWWTNTMFYEITDCGIDLPGCDIDGFGLTRPSRRAADGRTWPADFRAKPAFDQLRDFIAAHPELRGMDVDPPPEGPRVIATVGAPTVDGDLSDWEGGGFVTLDGADWQGDAPWGGLADLSVRLAARWSRGGQLVVGVEVTDDTHDADRPEDQLWAGDSLQLAFDVAGDGGTGYGPDDHEWTMALNAGGTAFRHEHGADGPPPEIAATASAGGVVYEVAFDGAALGTSLRAGTLRFSFLVNDADGDGREGWLELTPGIGRAKVPAEFGAMILTEDSPETDGGTRGADGGPSAGGDGGAPGLDAGTGSGSGGSGGGCAVTTLEPTPELSWLIPLAALWRRRRPRPR